MLRVQQLMIQNVQLCQSEDSLDAVARLLWDHDIGAIPVVDGERKVVAMLTDRDICMGACMTGRPLREIRVHEVMSKAVFSVRAEQLVDVALQIMREHQVRRVPVTDAQGRVVGILSQNDLITEAARERESQHKELGAPAITASLAAIGRSRSGELAVAAA